MCVQYWLSEKEALQEDYDNVMMEMMVSFSLNFKKKSKNIKEKPLNI